MKSIALSDIAKIVMGQSPPSSTYNTVGEGLPFFQGKADFGDLHPTVRMFCNKPQKVAEAGDILISVRAPVGPTNISPEKSCIGRGLAAIRSSKDLDSRYLLYFLRFYEPELAEAGKGSTFSAISRSDLERIQVPFPPLAEQKRIAAILAKADRLRRLRRTARDLSDTYLQSVFWEMFGDPIQNLRSWPRRMLKRLGKVVTGTTPPSSGENMFGGSIPFITPGDLEVDTLKTQRFVTEQGAEKSRTVRAGSTMVCCIGATIGKMDKARTLSAFNQQINAIEWNNEVDDDFGLIAMKFYAGVIVTRGRSTTLPILKKSEFEEISIPVPPLALQQRFAHVVHKFEQLRAQQREAQRQAEHLFQTLLQRAFRREL